MTFFTEIIQEEPSKFAWLLNLKNYENFLLCELINGDHTDRVLCIEDLKVKSAGMGVSTTNCGTRPQIMGVSLGVQEPCCLGVILCLLPFQITHSESECVG